MNSIDNQLQEIHRELQALYFRREAEQRGIQLHAARLQPIREQIKECEARREALMMESANEAERSKP